MPGHDIIVIGASAGGVEALREIIKGLPADIPAAVFVVLHLPSDATSVLPSILERAGQLPAHHPKDREALKPGRIYVAKPDCHLLIKRGYVRLVRGPKENSARPAVDPLFRTAARYYSNRVVGVVLSGTLDDGTSGLIAIKSRGGIAVVQEPDDALYSGMPRSALENTEVDYCLPASDIAALLTRLANEQVEWEEGQTMNDDMEKELDTAEFDLEAIKDNDRPGVPSRYTCPECHGMLFEIDEEGLLRFRCRVGHAYSAETLLSEQSEALEAALWAALRSLEENVALTKRLAHRMRERGNLRSAKRFDNNAENLQHRVGLIRKVLIGQPVTERPQADESRNSESSEVAEETT
jgi:two-component system chemotaxis response regulator CheB